MPGWKLSWDLVLPCKDCLPIDWPSLSIPSSPLLFISSSDDLFVLFKVDVLFILSASSLGQFSVESSTSETFVSCWWQDWRCFPKFESSSSFSWWTRTLQLFVSHYLRKKMIWYIKAPWWYLHDDSTIMISTWFATALIHRKDLVDLPVGTNLWGISQCF